MTGPDPTAASLTVARQRRVSPLVIVAAIVALSFLGVGALIISEWAPAGKDTSVVTGFILTTLAPTIVGLLALVRGDHAASLGSANAKRLVSTAAQVEEVARNVNGHLERHEELADKVLEVADSIANASTPLGQLGRQATARTRATDPPAVTPPTDLPVADAPPRAPDQS